MRTKHHILKVTGIALVAVGLLAGPASAATPINGTGTVHCNITGTIKFNPPLKTASTGTGHVAIKVKESNCGGTGNGAAITGGSSSGTETTTTNGCSGIAGTSHNTLTSTTKWKIAKGTAKLNPTVTTFTTETGNSTTPLSFDTSGSVTSGSFIGHPAGAHAVIQETLATIAAACGGKGLKQLHIVGTSTSSIT